MHASRPASSPTSPHRSAPDAPAALPALLRPAPDSARIDFQDPYDPAAPRLRLAFGAPLQTLVADRLDQVRPVLRAVQAAADAGRWCVGFVAYEAAPALDPALQVHPGSKPLAWFAVYDAARPWTPPAAVAPLQVDWQALLARKEFDAAMDRIHAAIRAGALYQVNYTAQMQGHWDAPDALALFAALQLAQPGGYAAYLDTGAAQILSVSPELFFDWQGGHLLTRPMKGTAARGSSPQADAAQEQALRDAPKERAENVMIVDLLRNDLSRLAQPHSVQVSRLFATQALPSVWQMTSDVSARTRTGCTLEDVFAALFPCGSVTGAPKVSAMQLIHVLEPQPRGVYCGALGVVLPGGAARFNVPIRTLSLQAHPHGPALLRCGIGSGITADATAAGEWAEWQHKQAFVERASQVFSLLETLALNDGRWRDAPAHLARMAQAAAHFGYPWDATRVQACLDALAQAHPHAAWRVRLLLDASGQPEAQAFALSPTPTPVRLRLAVQPFTQADSVFVRFKTTRRAHYDALAPTDAQVFDTVLWNSAGELTECTRGNLALQIDGRWLTPPLSCGLLGGVARARALREGRLVEAVVRVDDLPKVQAVAFLNSLRGWRDATLDTGA